MGAEDAARATLEQFIDATARRDLSLMRSLFHADAAFSGRLGQREVVGSIYPFFDHLAQNEVYSTYAARIVALSAAPGCAGARLEQRELFGATWDTFLHLRDGPEGWQITAMLSCPRA
ncbi:Putative lumazine-binding [Palleronia salina]|uniref:Putative lumazine-binding n=1 Tax=Palleronia salina TaxID=313368 RepID=A0A1M6DRQ9_9RHOB|nr:nuclear transport factor 2 family protein [Palleronia salina]SHI75799.1 Putative lumazine-binding [Palleronia salina]